MTHRRVATEAGVSLSSTTWHYATKTDILQAALHWTARREVDRIGAIADGWAAPSSTRPRGPTSSASG